MILVPEINISRTTTLKFQDFSRVFQDLCLFPGIARPGILKQFNSRTFQGLYQTYSKHWTYRVQARQTYRAPPTKLTKCSSDCAEYETKSFPGINWFQPRFMACAMIVLPYTLSPPGKLQNSETTAVTDRVPTQMRESKFRTFSGLFQHHKNKKNPSMH